VWYSLRSRADPAVWLPRVASLRTGRVRGRRLLNGAMQFAGSPGRQPGSPLLSMNYHLLYLHIRAFVNRKVNC